MAQDICNRPTRIAELVMDDPLVYGTVDAASSGMGGAIFPINDDNPPIAWHTPFPHHIQQRLVRFDNPHGTITNSDLELAGTIAQEHVVASNYDVRERTIGTGCDNSPAVSWRRKGSTTTTGPAAYLLREAGLQQRHHRYKTKIFHVPGVANTIADDCSRRFDLSDPQLLQHLNHLAPHRLPWELRKLDPSVRSSLISALRTRRPARLSRPSVPPPKVLCGSTPGSPSVRTNTSSTPRCGSTHNPWTSSWSTLNASGTAEPPVVDCQSRLNMYETKSPRWRRRSPFWGAPIPV